MEQVLYTPEEVATALHISRRKVYDMLRRREIESVRIGRCRRIPRVAVDRWLERLTNEAADA